MEEGRFFKTGEPYVMVVNRAFADWLGENPIGKSVTIDGMMGVITYRIIGIMENLLRRKRTPDHTGNLSAFPGRLYQRNALCEIQAGICSARDTAIER